VTPKERAFVNAYCGKAKGNGTKAAELAGYAKSGAHVTASRLLRNPKVAKAVAERQQRAEKASIATSDELDEILTNIARRAKFSPKDRIRAISEINKTRGRHSSTVNVNGRLTLEDALAASRD
jgi:phage terminase small subunit